LYNAKPRMKILRNCRDRREVLGCPTSVGGNDRQPNVLSSERCLAVALGEKYVSPSTSLFKRAILKPLALWVPVRWPRGFRTRPEMDQQQGGTPPVNFASDLENFAL